MKESYKALKRLENDYLWQRAIKSPKPHLDIGSGDSPIPGADPFDKPQGDAQVLNGLSSNTYGLVFSSHCLEHLRKWEDALDRWIEVIAPRGYLWLIVPDWYLYEQQVWPSRWNPDHKHYFTVDKLWHYASARTKFKILRIQQVDTHYDYSLKDVDQTLGDAEACVELVLRKL